MNLETEDKEKDHYLKYFFKFHNALCKSLKNGKLDVLVEKTEYEGKVDYQNFVHESLYSKSKKEKDKDLILDKIDPLNQQLLNNLSEKTYSLYFSNQFKRIFEILEIINLKKNDSEIIIDGNVNEELVKKTKGSKKNSKIKGFFELVEEGINIINNFLSKFDLYFDVNNDIDNLKYISHNLSGKSKCFYSEKSIIKFRVLSKSLINQFYANCLDELKTKDFNFDFICFLINLRGYFGTLVTLTYNSICLVIEKCNSTIISENYESYLGEIDCLSLLTLEKLLFGLSENSNTLILTERFELVDYLVSYYSNNNKANFTLEKTKNSLYQFSSFTSNNIKYLPNNDNNIYNFLLFYSSINYKSQKLMDYIRNNNLRNHIIFLLVSGLSKKITNVNIDTFINELLLKVIRIILSQMDSKLDLKNWTIFIFADIIHNNNFFDRSFCIKIQEYLLDWIGLNLRTNPDEEIRKILVDNDKNVLSFKGQKTFEEIQKICLKNSLTIMAAQVKCLVSLRKFIMFINWDLEVRTFVLERYNILNTSIKKFSEVFKRLEIEFSEKFNSDWKINEGE